MTPTFWAQMGTCLVLCLPGALLRHALDLPDWTALVNGGMAGAVTWMFWPHLKRYAVRGGRRVRDTRMRDLRDAWATEAQRRRERERQFWDAFDAQLVEVLSEAASALPPSPRVPSG